MDTNFSSHFAISLYDQRLRTVGVTYQHGTSRKDYVYKTHLELELGELVVCPVSIDGGGIAYVIGKVSAVHETVQIPKDSTIDYKWIVQKVDLAAHEAAAARDVKAIQAFAAFQRNTARIALAKELEEAAPGLGETMKKALGFDGPVVEEQQA